MGRSKAPFIDKRNATVYRLVHPDEDESVGLEESEKGQARVGRLVMVHGEKPYFSEDEEQEEYPYRSDSGDEGGEDDERPVVEEEYEEEEEDPEGGAEFVDDFGEDFDHEGEGARQYQWKRTDEDAQSEYSSWSKMSASSYLQPARRKQLWKDIDEFGLPDDGYDYTQHLRNTGAGVKMEAVMPTELQMALDKKQQRSRAAAPKDAKEVLQILEEDSSDEEAPALEEGEPNAPIVVQGRKLVDEGRVVEEGELPDDILRELGGCDEEDGGELDAILGQERDQRLVDERFDVFLNQYADDKIGELSEDVGPTHNGELDEQYYYDLLKQYIKTGDMEGKEILQAGGADVEEDEEGEWVQRPSWREEPRGYTDIGENPTEEEAAELAEKTRMLAIREAEEESEESTEEVEVDEKEQWDCESILSTYSNLYNHPKLIEDSRQGVKIKLHPRTGVPIGARLPTKADLLDAHVRNASAGEALREEEEEEEEEEEDAVDYKSEIQSVVTDIMEMGARQRGESAEQKKARKELAKQQKALQREKKKERVAGAAIGAALKQVPSAADPRARGGISVTRF